ncbi:hypothetical protein [Cohnella zeiphila]|uniref:Uncharacterized protein n=1 Tax=Cohnella zeiphila TaxID=2761120 RepID=A0A7X0VYU4_9BACL|nr:hypothetical protein [Cohnella zeiphila]MBB6734872.1 hypothetical protein [Cohnella zeiphila]
MWNDSVPVDKERLLQLRGLPVCIVMKDGERHYGVLTGCSRGKIVLNGSPDDEVGKRTGRTGKGVRKGGGTKEKKGRKPHAGIAASSAKAVPPAAAASSGGWGFLQLDGPTFSSERIVLPLKPVEAVLLL